MTKRDFLVEIGTGELPPKALRALSEAFLAHTRTAFDSAGLTFDRIDAFATPRRLAVRALGLVESQPDKVIEKTGPAVAAAFDKSGAPTPAALGFARSCGVALEQLEHAQKDGTLKLVFRSFAKGSQTSELLPDMITKALASLPIPKKMRWGSTRDEFVRPVHWVVMLFGTDVIPAQILGIPAGNQSRGHRFMHPTPVTISAAATYEAALREAKVLVNYEERKTLVRALVEAEGARLNASVVIDDDLLEEVTSLVEWPVALTGRFEKHFLEVPSEALISSMKSHQKCFYLLDSQGALLPNFITLANIESADPAQVIAGNERVIRPRLSDAKFFYDTDRKTSLEARSEQLKSIIFQQELGTVYEKSARVAELSAFIATQLQVDQSLCRRAAQLGKADLLTNLVSEFAELQGIAGYYYALNDGEPMDVALALNEQYMPRFSGDRLPSSMTGCVLAVADKLDTIVGLFAIGQPPTGSKDPFALRRAALGILRIIVEKQLDLNLIASIQAACAGYKNLTLKQGLDSQVFDFLLERFKAWYQGEGISVEVFQSVLALKPAKPLEFHRRVHAVHEFSRRPEAQALAAANKRVSNILQKQGASLGPTVVDASLLQDEAESALVKVLEQCRRDTAPLFAASRFAEGLEVLAGSRVAIDAFFDAVLVMDEDLAVRQNRINILRELRSLFLQVADISCLQGN
jgi:glycyl-tRNA synthetase beta chain